MLPFIPAQMSAEQKGLEDSAMGDGVHATVSVEQLITVQNQSLQTTYHPKNGEKACPCCQFYGVPCRQVCATEDEATTRRIQRLFSSTKRKRSHQEQLAEDSLFLDGPLVDELQTIQKRKDPECSRDTQVKNQALYDYVDGLTITMNVIQPRGHKESKKQAEEIMQDVMISSQGGQPSSAIHRLAYATNAGKKVIMPKVVHRITCHRKHQFRTFHQSRVPVVTRPTLFPRTAPSKMPRMTRISSR